MGEDSALHNFSDLDLLCVRDVHKKRVPFFSS
jgi:hypothetical protein